MNSPEMRGGDAEPHHFFDPDKFSPEVSQPTVLHFCTEGLRSVATRLNMGNPNWVNANIIWSAESDDSYDEDGIGFEFVASYEDYEDEAELNSESYSVELMSSESVFSVGGQTRVASLNYELDDDMLFDEPFDYEDVEDEGEFLVGRLMVCEKFIFKCEYTQDWAVSKISDISIVDEDGDIVDMELISTKGVFSGQPIFEADLEKLFDNGNPVLDTDTYEAEQSEVTLHDLERISRMLKAVGLMDANFNIECQDLRQ